MNRDEEVTGRREPPLDEFPADGFPKPWVLIKQDLAHVPTAQARRFGPVPADPNESEIGRPVEFRGVAVDRLRLHARLGFGPRVEVVALHAELLEEQSGIEVSITCSEGEGKIQDSLRPAPGGHPPQSLPLLPLVGVGERQVRTAVLELPLELDPVTSGIVIGAPSADEPHQLRSVPQLPDPTRAHVQDRPLDLEAPEGVRPGDRNDQVPFPSESQHLARLAGVEVELLNPFNGRRFVELRGESCQALTELVSIQTHFDGASPTAGRRAHWRALPSASANGFGTSLKV